MRIAVALSVLVLAFGCSEPNEYPPGSTDGPALDVARDATPAAVDASTPDAAAPAPDGPAADVAGAYAAPDAPAADLGGADVAPEAAASCQCVSFQTCAVTRCSPSYDSARKSPALPGIPWDLAVAPDDSFYVAGIFKGTVDFDPGPALQNITALAAGDVFVSRYDSAGKYLWTRTVPSTGDEPWVHVTAAPDGSALVSGPFKGTADFFPGRAEANKTSRATDADEAYVLKLLADGSFGYVRTLPAGWSLPFDVETAADGTATVVGYFAGPIDFGTGTTDAAGVTGGFALRLAPTGATVWSKFIAGGAIGVTRVGNDGTVALVGDFAGKTDLDPGLALAEANAGATGRALYAVTLNSVGQYVGSVAVPMGAKEVVPRDVAFAADGGLLLAGHFIEGALPLAGGAAPPTKPAAGDHDGFVARISSDHRYLWGRAFGGAAYDYTWSVTALPDGDVLASGIFNSPSVDFGSAAMPVVREQVGGNFFLARLAPDGATRGVTLVGPPRSISPILLRLKSTTLIVGGFFGGTVDFNPGADKDEQNGEVRSAFLSRYLF